MYLFFYTDNFPFAGEPRNVFVHSRPDGMGDLVSAPVRSGREQLHKLRPNNISVYFRDKGEPIEADFYL